MIWPDNSNNSVAILTELTICTVYIIVKKTQSVSVEKTHLTVPVYNIEGTRIVNIESIGLQTFSVLLYA